MKIVDILFVMNVSQKQNVHLIPKKNLKLASNSITNLLNNLKFKCINDGYDEIINYIDIKSHQNLCHYQKMICRNKECNEQILKKI